MSRRSGTAMAQPSTVRCYEHAGQAAKYHCVDCEVNICVTCYIEVHRTHDHIDVQMKVVQLRQQIRRDVHRVDLELQKCQRTMAELAMLEDRYACQVSRLHSEINEEASRLKAIIDTRIRQLHAEVASENVKRLERSKQARRHLTNRMADMKNFEKYAIELANSGSGGEVEKAAEKIHDTAEQMMQPDDTAAGDYSQIIFIPSNILDNQTENVVGEVGAIASNEAGEKNE